ncbi:MAG: hypothetical protein K2R98_05920 [Gemmataceae bacterium]|nr:hypothetical protein [Gemmataceae bacterium]
MDRNPAAPVEADLRRGISTAYYALFHLLIHEATTQVVAIATLRPRIARAFDHKVMRNVCQDYRKLIPDATGQLLTPAGEIVPRGLQDVASEFVALQEARHQADYNAGVAVAHVEADTDVMRAEVAFIDWQAVRTDPAAATFLAELLCRGIPKR